MACQYCVNGTLAQGCPYCTPYNQYQQQYQGGLNGMGNQMLISSIIDNLKAINETLTRIEKKLNESKANNS